MIIDFFQLNQVKFKFSHESICCKLKKMILTFNNLEILSINKNITILCLFIVVKIIF